MKAVDRKWRGEEARQGPRETQKPDKGGGENGETGQLILDQQRQ